MESTRFLRKFNDLVRYDKPQNSLPFLLMIIIGVLATFNSCIVVLTEQENLEKCLSGIKDIVAIVILFSGIVERGLKPEKAMQLVKLIEDEFLVNRYDLVGREEKWDRIEMYYDGKRKDMKRMSQKISAVMVLVYIGSLNRNLVNELIGGTAGFEKKSRDWPTPFVYWLPSGLDSFAFFIYMYSFQGLMLFFVALEAFSIQTSVCLATERVLVDFETIYLLLDDLANDFPVIGFDDNYLSVTLPEQESSFKDEKMKTENLRRDMARIVHCHQTLNRNFKTCAENSAYVILISSCAMSVDTCVNIYIMLKADDLKTKMNYAAACFFVNLIVFFSYYTGQRVVNQNDVFRRSLAEVPWVDKPLWFKKSLHLMMGRANVDIEIKPYSIYVLNYMSFKNIMKAAFSFGNFLYTKKLQGQVQQ